MACYHVFSLPQDLRAMCSVVSVYLSDSTTSIYYHVKNGTVFTPSPPKDKIFSWFMRLTLGLESSATYFFVASVLLSNLTNSLSCHVKDGAVFTPSPPKDTIFSWSMPLTSGFESSAICSLLAVYFSLTLLSASVALLRMARYLPPSVRSVLVSCAEGSLVHRSVNRSFISLSDCASSSSCLKDWSWRKMKIRYELNWISHNKGKLVI